MKWIKKNMFLIIFLIILIVLSIILLYFNNEEKIWSNEQNFENSLKHYEENEYIPVNISYDQIARIYLQDYVYKLIFNREDAYNTLDSDYRNAKFSSFEDFNEYIDDIMSLKTREMKVVDYAFTDKNNYRYIDVHDSANNLFIFKEEGVMQYSVYLDRYTVDLD